MKRPSFLRISLRSLMIFVTIMCVWLGWWIKSAMDQKNAVKQLINGASCFYDIDYDYDYGEPRVLHAFRTLLGTDAVRPFEKKERRSLGRNFGVLGSEAGSVGSTHSSWWAS